LAVLKDTVWEWYKDRGEHFDVFDETEVEKAKQNPLYILGSMAYLFWIVTLVTGFWLVIYYRPTTYQAYSSIEVIQDQIPFGWLLRGMHKYAADAFIIACTMRLYRMYFTAEYRRPKELSYMVAVLLLVFGMFSGLTGYLLQWNQRSYWATKVFATFPTYLNHPYMPGVNIGTLIASIMLGGAAIGPNTITRFYCGHYMLSLILLVLVELHFYKRTAQRINMSRFAIFISLMMLVAISAILPATLGRRADPSMTPERIYSDWYFLGLYHLYRIQSPFWATVFTVGLPVVAWLAPFFDRRGSKKPMDRPLVFINGVLCMGFWLLFTTLIIMNIANIRRDPPMFVGLGSIILTFGMMWEIARSRRKRGEPRPVPAFPEALAAGAWLCVLFPVLYAIYKPVADALNLQNFTDLKAVMHALVQPFDLYKQIVTWHYIKPSILAQFASLAIVLTLGSIHDIRISRRKEGDREPLISLLDITAVFLWAMGIVSLVLYNMRYGLDVDKDPMWWLGDWQPLFICALCYFGMAFVATIGTIVDKIRARQPVAEEAHKTVGPQKRPNPDTLYAYFYAAFFALILLIGSFGLIAEF